MDNQIQAIRQKLASLGKKDIAEHSKKYLKSDYSFYGFRVPQLRKIAKEFNNLDIYSAYNLFDELWNSGNHEEMSLALYILGNFRKKFPKQEGIETWNFLFKNARIERAKSWDHIDELSSHITGEIFFNHPNLTAEIKQLAQSRNHWMRRLSIVSQYPNIKKGGAEMLPFIVYKNTNMLVDLLLFKCRIYWPL